MLPTKPLTQEFKRELAKHPFKDLRQAHDHLVRMQALYEGTKLVPHHKSVIWNFDIFDEKDIPTDQHYIHLEPWIMAAAQPRLGSDPLNPDKNIYYKLWQCYYQHGKSPNQDYLELVARYKGTDTKIDKPDEKSLAIYNQWQSNERLYSPKHIHDLLIATQSPANFQRSHNLPDLLTYSETVYILLVCMQSSYYGFKKNELKNINRRLEDYTRHLFPTGALETNLRSKLGRTYGTWRLLECLSQNENTSNNASVYYFAKCGLCGHESQVNYRTVASKRCPKCAELAKEVSKPESRGMVLPQILSVYLLSNGRVSLRNDRPENAVARIKFSHLNQDEPWEYYEAGYIEPQAVALEREAAKDNVEDAKPEENKGMKALFKRDDSLFGF